VFSKENENESFKVESLRHREDESWSMKWDIGTDLPRQWWWRCQHSHIY